MLHQIEPDPGEAGPVVQLIAENRSADKLTIVRPRAYWFAVGGACGWTLKVTGPGGEYHPPVPPGSPPILRPEDVAVLFGDEGVSVRLNLMSWIGTNGKKPVAGEYTVEAEYASPKGRPNFDKSEAREIPIPRHVPVKSEALKFRLR